MERGFTRLSSLPAENAAGYEVAKRQMLEEVLGSDTLGTYLVISNTPLDAPRVTVLHSIARYSAGFGGSNALHGRVLGLLGEMVEDQLPTMIQFIDDPVHDLLHGLMLEEVRVQPAASVEAYFANPIALELMPKVAAMNGGVNSNLSCLCPLPLAWAPYFMDFKTPAQAYAMGQVLVATLANAAERTQVDPFLDWLKASTQRMGAGAADRTRSVLNMGVEPTAPSPRVITWMKSKLAQYRQPRVAFPAAVSMPGVPMAPPVLNDRLTSERDYSQLETEKIQAACGLTDAQWNTHLPPVYGRMLEEGRKTAKVRALLTDLLRPDDPSSLNSVIVHVTDEMAKDLKELNFGFGNDLTYASCHRGISPFAVVGISMATASGRRRKTDRLKRATHLSVADISDNDTFPDPLPTKFLGLMELLKRYLAYLRTVTEVQCSHYAQVLRIAKELVNQAHVFEDIVARQIASLVWQIFLDARRFFSAGTDMQGNLPVSRLTHTYNDIAAGLMLERANVPYEDLVISSAPTWSGDPTRRERAPARGSPPTGPKIFARVPVEIRAAMHGAVHKYPNITMSAVMLATEPPTPYSQVKLGPAGACMDFLALGRCKDSACTFKHDGNTTIAASQIGRVAPKIAAAYAQYDASH